MEVYLLVSDFDQTLSSTIRDWLAEMLGIPDFQKSRQPFATQPGAVRRELTYLLRHDPDFAA